MRVDFYFMSCCLDKLYALSAGGIRSLGGYSRILCLLAFGILLMSVSGIQTIGMETENQPLATLEIDVEKNFINLSDFSQVMIQDLKPNTDYTISIASSAKSGDVLMPVMILRGDREKGAVWEFMHNGALRTFNSGLVTKLNAVFIDSDASDNSYSAMVIVKQENSIVATVSLDAKENCLDIINMPQAVEQKLKADTEYEVAVSSTAVIGPVSLPVMVMRGDKDIDVSWEFMMDGDIIIFNFGSKAWLKALFIGAGGYQVSGEAKITFSLPPPDIQPDNDKK